MAGLLVKENTDRRPAKLGLPDKRKIGAPSQATCVPLYFKEVYPLGKLRKIMIFRILQTRLGKDVDQGQGPKLK